MSYKITIKMQKKINLCQIAAYQLVVVMQKSLLNKLYIHTKIIVGSLLLNKSTKVESKAASFLLTQL